MFGTVHFAGTLGWASYSIFPILGVLTALFITIAFRYGPGMNDASENLRRDVQSRLHIYPKQVRKGFKSAVRSCPDLKVRCGSFFVYEWSTMVTSLQIAADNTFTLLIAVK